MDMVLDGSFVKEHREVYKTIPGGDLKATACLPEDWSRSDSRTGMVFFGGGGWRNQNPDQFMQHAIHLAQKGIVAVTAEYRTTSQHGATPAESVKDAKSAVRWLRSMSGKLGVNPRSIIASGGSAGGHIAACAATVPGFDEDAEQEVSCVPDGLVLFNPVLNLTSMDPSSDAKVFMAKVGLSARLAELSPTLHIKPGTAPTVIFHGTDDRLVPFSQALDFSGKMSLAGNECTVHPAEGQGHGFFNYRVSMRLNRGKWYRFCLDRCTEFVLGFQPG